MARRRGNKKRRDVKRNSTGFRRAAKIGIMAAGVAAGGYKIMNSEIGRRAIQSGVIDELAKTRKNIKRDLLNKPKNLRTLKSAFDRNIGKDGEIFKRNLANRKNLTKATNTKLGRKLISAEQTKNKFLKEMKKDTADKVKKDFHDTVVGAFENEELRDQVSEFINSLYDKVTEQNIGSQDLEGNIVGRTVLDHYKKRDKMSLTDDQVSALLEEIIAHKKANPIVDQDIIDQHGKLGDWLLDRRRQVARSENLGNQSFLHKAIDTLTGTRALTVKDLKDFDIDFGSTYMMDFHTNELHNIDVNNIIKNLGELEDKYGDTIIDRALRVGRDSNGNKVLMDYRSTAVDFEKMIDNIKESLPGKILLKNVDLGEKHGFGVLRTGKRDVNAYLTGAKDNIMQDAMVFLDGTLYGIKRDANGVSSLDYSNATEVREVTNWRKIVTQELLGTEKRAYEAYENPWAKLLDINQDGSFNLKNEIKRALDHTRLGDTLGIETDEMWEKNQLRTMKNYINGAELNSQSVTEVSRMYDSALMTSRILNRNITGVSDELMDNLINSGRFSEQDTNVLRLLLEGSPESLNEVINGFASNVDDLKNDRLSNMIKRIYRDIDSSADIEHISMKKGMPNLLFGTGIDEQWVRDEVGQFRVEYVKKLLLEEAQENDGSYMGLIRDVAKNDLQHQALRDIGMLGMFEDSMNLEGNVVKDMATRFQPRGAEDRFRNTLAGNIEMLQSFNDIMNDAILDFNPINRGYMDSINEINHYQEYNDLTLIRKSKFNIKDILSSINTYLKDPDAEYDGSAVGSYIKDALKEVTVAGRNHTDSITEATILAQYSMSRLNYSLNEFGLGLSADSMSSPLNTYLNFGLKRILPIAFGLGAASYLNDESRRFLGSSITEAGIRGASYVDIGARKLIYKTNILPIGNVGNFLNGMAETSVIHEYLFGSNRFDTAEEREDYYENGYSPVRKGRFWSFGSSSEFRGGSITYWQPNMLRRAESNYHDISVYGSSEEKWAHSWIPTPTHPLSTLRAALNPYWLEKKHLKEGDRPYPLTSKLFTEGTPWGAVLNPTVGELLKPVRMLPEVRLRLGHNGRDSKAVINRINERLKDRDRSNDDLLIVSGTDIRNAEYVPFGNPTEGEMNFTIRGGDIVSPGYGFMEDVPDMSDYGPPTGEDYVQMTRGGGRTLISAGEGAINANNIFGGMTNYGGSNTTERIGRSIIQSINEAIKNHNSVGTRSAGVMNDKSNSTYIYRNLVNEYNNYIDNWYGERVDPTLIRKSLTYDYARDMMYSTSQISGIYGYLGNLFTGSDNSYTFRYESAEQMNSFSRTFWDASVGGLGFGPMEIARRFFPSEQKNRINVNPLVNNMPDWIPDSYRTGDPYTNIPKGEMRLPGKGYEAMYDLHPDQFGDYGAFDRYKILADIAPNSKEYKKWRNIAKATVVDPELQNEMKQIAERTAKMSGNHEFFEYKFLKNDTVYSKGIVQSVQGGNVILTDKTVLSLAGVLPTENTQYALQDMLSTGQEITYRHAKQKQYTKDNPWNNYVTKSILYVPGSAESLNRALIESGQAEKDVDDNSTIALLGRINPAQEAMGAIQEAVAHAHIPIVHNKFLRVDSSYESYMKETYYGTSFKTWDHPINAFIKPMINEQSNKTLFSEALSLAVAHRHFTKSVYSTNKAERWASNILLTATNPTAFLGGNISYILKMSVGGKGAGQELNNWQKGAKLGVALGTVKYAWDNADNPFKSMAGMAMAGATLASKDFGWEVAEKYIGKMSIGKGTAIGAGIGLAMSAIKNPRFDKEKMFGKWAPKDTRKKWDLDDYFDRLEYMKYSGLYERAAAKARRKEKVDIKGIFEQVDKNKKKIAKLNLKAAKLTEKMKNTNDKYAIELAKIDAKKKTLEEQSTMMMQGGEYTKSAIAYKKKMESTMYGLDPTATKDELLAAVPDAYKDYFTAFMDITDKKEQKKILRSVSPSMRRPLQAAWGMKLERIDSNRKYFRVHAMPGAGWRGWRPNVNLKYVKMKTIENEGMMLSDFGYYESEKAKTTFEDAPDIRGYDQGQMFRTLDIATVMKGHGLHIRNVSIEKTRAPGITIVGDVKEKFEDHKDAAGYKLAKMTYHLGSLF